MSGFPNPMPITPESRGEYAISGLRAIASMRPSGKEWGDLIPINEAQRRLEVLEAAKGCSYVVRPREFDTIDSHGPFDLIYQELEHAVQKHPEFAASIMEGVCHFAEEVAEAIRELAAGNWKAAIKELAQVGAVCVRLIKLVRKIKREQKYG